jgi:LCP family protein required for cell wall assembly
MQGDKNNQFRGGIDGFITPRNKPKPQVRPTLDLPRPKPEIAPQKPVNTENNSEAYRQYSTYKNRPINQRVNHPTKKKRSRKKKVILTLLTLFILIGGAGVAFGASLIGNLDKALHGNIFSDVHALVSTTKLSGEDQGRVNILLAGDSADDPGHAGADLTDSIMLLSIDTKNHTGFMLSIPRDLWVNIPNYGQAKINSANTITNFSQSGYPSGGMGQLQEIVQTDLGIPVNYYALLNYNAFKDAVNAVGGITINIQSPDPRGIYDAYTQLSLPNGIDHLSGQEALNLARARGDNSAGDVSYGLPNSDFDRTMHQRQMLVALAQKAKSLSILANPFKASKVFSSFTNNISTNLNFADVLRLNQLTKGMDITKLQSITYSYGGPNGLLTDYVAPDGEDALSPTEGVNDFGQLQQFYQQLTSNNPVVKEAPSVVVLNSTNTENLAHSYSVKFKSGGFNVAGIADANNEYPTTMIVDLTGSTKPASLSLLKTVLPRDTTVVNSDSSTAEAIQAQGYNANFVVILGDDSVSQVNP